jgi:hypothetical protein
LTRLIGLRKIKSLAPLGKMSSYNGYYPGNTYRNDSDGTGGREETLWPPYSPGPQQYLSDNRMPTQLYPQHTMSQRSANERQSEHYCAEGWEQQSTTVPFLTNYAGAAMMMPSVTRLPPISQHVHQARAKPTADDPGTRGTRQYWSLVENNTTGNYNDSLTEGCGVIYGTYDFIKHITEGIYDVGYQRDSKTAWFFNKWGASTASGASEGRAQATRGLKQACMEFGFDFTRSGKYCLTGTKQPPVKNAVMVLMEMKMPRAAAEALALQLEGPPDDRISATPKAATTKKKKLPRKRRRVDTTDSRDQRRNIFATDGNDQSRRMGYGLMGSS